MGGLDALPCDALVHALGHCSAATLVRSAMACRALRDAAERVARRRVASLGLEVDDDCWVQLAQRPLATVFRSELEALVHRAPRGWRTSGAFLWFRLAEEDLNDAVADGAPLLLCDGAGAVEWLHDQRGLDDAYSAARRGEGGDVELVELRLQTHATLWHDATDAHLAYARHLALHPCWGRPFDARTRRDFYWALFDESETVLDPHGGPPWLVLRHHAVGDRGGCWWQCSLCFYDALERQ